MGSAVGRRAIGLLVLLAIGGIAIHVYGDDEKPKSQEQQFADEIAESTNDVATAAAHAISASNAELQLKLKGMWKPLRIRSVKPTDEGISVVTGLPAGDAKSTGGATRVCKLLLGSGDPGATAPEQVEVVADDGEPISAPVCSSG